MKKNNYYSKKIIGILFIILLLNACTDPDQQKSLIINGYKPIYISKSQAQQIYSDAPQNIVQLGKIYTKFPYIYINESGMGVHVFDNTNPANPIRVAFIHIPGNHDIAIKDNYLYADNITDLVTINISNIQNIEVVNRVPNMYPLTQVAYPLNFGGYFECVDTTKGMIIGWQEAELENPQCHR